MKTIRQLRTEQGMTQREVAESLGVTVATVYLWEQQQVEPKASQLRELARLFGVSMDDIDFDAVNRKSRHRDVSQ
ncbi:MAG: helix-turn-helix transcriptional regulator [Thermomicrobiales bacterium]